MVGEVGPGAFAGFLLGGTCPLEHRAGLCPSGGQVHVRGCVLGVAVSLVQL